MTQNDTNKLIENQISHNSRITSIEDNNILHNFNDVNSNLFNIFMESEKLETGSKHINWKDSNFDLHDLVKLRKGCENNSIIGYLNINHLSTKIDYRNKNEGSKIVIIREGLITKRLKAFKGDIFEMICLEVTISKKGWFITYVY